MKKRGFSQLSLVPSSGEKVKRVRAANLRKPSLAAKVRNIIRNSAETKEINSLDSSNTAGGYIFCINQIAEGDDDNQRNGRNIQPKACYVDYYISMTAAAAEDTGFVALVWDKQPNGGAATFLNVFDTSAANPGQALRNTTSFKDRFQVLWLEPFVRQSCQSGSLGNSSNCRGRKYYSFPTTWKCEYGSTAASVPTTGALYVMMGSKNNTGTTASATITYNARFSYTDY